MSEPRTPNAEVEAIDLTISRMTAQLLELKTRRNSLIPIGRIPRELLIVIFEFHFYGISGSSSFLHQKEYLRGLCPIIHTCSMWRDASRQCHILWSTIHRTSSAPATAWMLEQGGNADLRVLSATYMDGISAQAAGHVSRIAEIGSGERSLTSDDNVVPLVHSVAQSSCSLNVLAVDFSDQPREDVQASLNTLMENSARSLKTLHISHSLVRFEAMPRFTNLRSLFIEASYLGSNDELYEALSALAVACPLLHTLLMDERRDSDLSFPKEVIHFPALSHLGCGLRSNRIRFIAAILALPPRCRLRIFNTFGSEDAIPQEYFDTMLAVLHKTLSGCGFGAGELDSSVKFTFKSLCLTLVDDEIEFSADDVVHEYRTRGEVLPYFNEVVIPGGWPCVQIGLDIPGPRRDSALSTVLQALSAADVETLSLWIDDTCSDCINTDHLADALRPFTALKILRISGLHREILEEEIVQAVLEALGPGRQETAHGGPPPRTPAPRLRHIEIEYVHDEYTIDDEPANSTTDLFEILFDLLAYRAESGSPLDSARLLGVGGGAVDVFTDGHLEYVPNLETR